MDAVKVLNPDGTTSVTGFKKIIKRKDGTIDWSKAKSPNIHTIAPASWDNAKILSEVTKLVIRQVFYFGNLMV